MAYGTGYHTRAIPAGLKLHVHSGALSMLETMWVIRRYETPLSPEITMRVTGNTSLRQRDTVSVKKREAT
jgi:hypothetical protein